MVSAADETGIKFMQLANYTDVANEAGGMIGVLFLGFDERPHLLRTETPGVELR